MRCRHAMPFGAELAAGGGVDFRLWAPAAQRAELACYAGASGKPAFLPAEADRDGWWSCHVDEAGAGTLYRWRIDGELLVPDPASRQNPGGVEAPSAVVDPLQFEWDAGWQGRPWRETVLYEMHVGAFTPEGTFDAASQRLGALADVGITAIELMPLADFPGRFGWGYDGVLPFAPKPEYGTPDELKHFVQQAHRLGMMVFVDVVYNHFGPQGNYLHAYAPQFFSATHDSPWGKAINFDGPGSRTVRDFFIHNALYWVQEFRVDGLRLDAVHAVADASQPHILQELSAAVRRATAGRHVHLVLENEDNHYGWLAREPVAGRYDAQWNDDFHHAVHVAMTGETRAYYHDYGASPLDQLARALANGMLYQGCEREPGGARKHVIAAPAQRLSTLVNFAHNHDQVGNRAFGERLSQLVPAGARELPTLLALLTPAIPMLFLGEEYGAPQPFLYFADWDGELRDAVRAGRLREFGSLAGAGSGRELPDACCLETFEASRLDAAHAQSPAGRAWHDLVRRALQARRKHITPREPHLLDGRHTSQRVGATGIAVQWRYDDGQVLSLQLNLGPDPLHVPDEHQPPAQGVEVFSHQWPQDAANTWPAWAARWQLGPEVA